MQSSVSAPGRPRPALRAIPGAGFPARPRGLAIDPRDLPTRAFLALASLLARYHRHRVYHLGRLTRLIAAGRRVILVGNHALDIVDPLLFIARLYRTCGAVPRFVGHEAGWFRVPVLRDIAMKWQVIPSPRLTPCVR